MKKRILSLLLAMSLIFSLATTAGVTVSAEITLEAPSTNDDGVYQIDTAGKLYWFAALVNGTLSDGTQNLSANAELTQDITVNSDVLDESGNLVSNTSNFQTWTPISNYSYPTSSGYCGSFNGKGYTIRGLYLNENSTDAYYYYGLFGRIGKNGSVSNVNVEDSYFGSYQYVGGICGNNAGTISGCTFKGNIAGNKSGSSIGERFGGICGYNVSGAMIENCVSRCTVSSNGGNSVGGICGDNVGTINKCITYRYSDTSENGISGPKWVGGICGYNRGVNTENCINFDQKISGSEKVGGVVGYNQATITGCFYYCTAFSSSEALLASKDYGFVCGYNYDNSTVSNCCYYIKDIADSDKNDMFRTEEQFKNGDVTYLLNGGLSTQDCVWKQTIGVDDFPNWESEDIVYSNFGKSHNHAESVTVDNCPICKLKVPGKDNDVYQISSKEELFGFAIIVNNGETSANAVLTDNITVNDNIFNNGSLVTDTSNLDVWTPIGSENNAYTGTFDGQSHTVSGLYFNDDSTNNVGLFGYVGAEGNISNVGVIGSYIKAASNVGGVCGQSGGTIDNCYNSSKINGTSYAGGVCGLNESGTIEKCYNNAAVNGSGIIVGGVCGYSIASDSSDSEITDCYNNGEIKGQNYIGGVCGYNTGSHSEELNNYGRITYCYNNGKVTITATETTEPSEEQVYIGGVCGYNKDTIEHGYNNKAAYDGSAMGNAEDTETVATKDESSFASGEVAYLLNDGRTRAWGQKLTGDNPETMPVFGGETVYFASNTYHNHDASLVHCDICNADTLSEPVKIDNYYQIYTPAELYWFADYANKVDNTELVRADLMADITVNKNVVDANGNLSADADKFRKRVPIGAGKTVITYAEYAKGDDEVASIENNARSLAGVAKAYILNSPDDLSNRPEDVQNLVIRWAGVTPPSQSTEE